MREANIPLHRRSVGIYHWSAVLIQTAVIKLPGSPSLDNSLTCVHHVIHLEVYGCGQDGEDAAVIEGQTGSVHKVQKC